MRILLALIIGIAIGAAALWFFSSGDKSQLKAAGHKIQETTEPARQAIQEKLKVLDLQPQDIKEELEKTGRVVRRKARDLGQAVADATADARTTAAIKANLVKDTDLSSLGLSVNTTGGVVTLSGYVDSPDDIGKAMVSAMEVEGVREVISTLQVKPKAEKK